MFAELNKAWLADSLLMGESQYWLIKNKTAQKPSKLCTLLDPEQVVAPQVKDLNAICIQTKEKTCKYSYSTVGICGITKCKLCYFVSLITLLERKYRPTDFCLEENTVKER